MAKEKTNTKKKPHIVLGLIIVLLIVPFVILVAILLNSLEDSAHPVVGQRYKNELDPAITEENIATLTEKLTFEGVDNVQINFKTARVAILIDAADDASAATIDSLIHDAYARVNEVLPIETYFTNNYIDEETYIKMYDLEIDVYNVIEGENQIHYVVTKSGAQEEAHYAVVSSPKNQEVSDSVQSQNQEEGE